MIREIEIIIASDTTIIYDGINYNIGYPVSVGIRRKHNLLIEYEAQITDGIKDKLKVLARTMETVAVFASSDSKNKPETHDLCSIVLGGPYSVTTRNFPR